MTVFSNTLQGTRYHSSAFNPVSAGRRVVELSSGVGASSPMWRSQPFQLRLIHGELWCDAGDWVWTDTETCSPVRVFAITAGPSLVIMESLQEVYVLTPAEFEAAMHDVHLPVPSYPFGEHAALDVSADSLPSSSEVVVTHEQLVSLNEESVFAWVHYRCGAVQFSVAHDEHGFIGYMLGDQVRTPISANVPWSAADLLSLRALLNQPDVVQVLEAMAG